LSMTMRERMLAVVEGREHDRVPFVLYDGIGPSMEEAWSVFGRDNVGMLRWGSPYRAEYPNCRFESEEVERDGLRGLRTTMFTPAGQLTSEMLYQPTYDAGAIREHYVKEPEDYEVLMAYLRDLVVLDNCDEVEGVIQGIGEDGLCHLGVPRTPYQQLWVEWVSIENLGLHLVDCPEILEECISLMAANAREIYKLVPKAGTPYVVIPDNITAPVIGDRYFRKYCLPLYQELSGIAAEAGVLVYGHFDGDLKPLWQAIGESGVRGIDSLSPPPDNDTSVGEAVSMWPEMRVGVNFPSSVHLAEPEVVYEQARRILEEGGHSGRLQIQISENVPPGVWWTSYPQILKAVEEFGRP